MGAEDVRRQSINVYRIKLLGAHFHPVDSGTATLRDALNDNGLSLIKLAAPTTDQKRLEDIIKISSGFIYQVNVSGVTGVKSANETDVANFVKRMA